ncbi:MAG TPA: DUF2948 family protein [Devosia sp.]|nr:DUF2948 family protein [Devosia sp.]
MTDLKLLALDEDDLQVISAHMQDAVVRVGDMGFAKSDARFACIMNRYVWEKGVNAGNRRAGNGERRRCALHFDHVRDIASTGINLEAQDGILELLSIGFSPDDAPAGTTMLTFAGGGTIRLKVDCLEARMRDLGASWAAKATPSHSFDDD